MHVTFDESYPRNVGKCIYFRDPGVFSEDILKDTEKGIDQPEVVKPEEEEEDDNNEKEKDERLTKIDDFSLPLRSSN